MPSKTDFLLDPQVIFLNHGSFGACPRPVFESYQRWQLELERQPVLFLGQRITDLLAESRTRLAQFLNAADDEAVYFPNPTTALNMVIRSLALKPGDEILTTNHEYGALDRTWRYYTRQWGAHYINHPIPLPVTTREAFIDQFWSGVTDKTRMIFLSHITSPTALTFPVDEICRRARAAGILSIVDGAHAPGQIGLDLKQVGADIYAGALHKWLCAPKGAAFIYVRSELQSMLDPLVISWGWESDHPGASRFIDHQEWQGTRDLSAYLTVPAAIDYQIEHDWPSVRGKCHLLACQTRGRISKLTGLAQICPDSAGWYAQMFSAPLPPGMDIADMKSRLMNEYQIEVPIISWANRPFIRVSFQAYNAQSDADALIRALQELL